MSQKEITCTFTGPRPHKLPNGLDHSKLLLVLGAQIDFAVLQGYTVFQSGMAMGVDIVAGELVALAKAENPRLRLHCFLPYATQADRWPTHWRERYLNLLAHADEITCLQDAYTAGCAHRRNRAMVDRCSRLVAIYDGVASGGTA